MGDRTRRDVNVRKDSHVSCCRLLGNPRGTLARQPSSEFRGLVHVVSFELGVLSDDVVGRVSVAEKLEDEIDRDAKPTNRRPPLADSRVDANSVEHA